MNTLTIVLDKTRTHVLMCYNKDCGQTFICGKTKDIEDPIQASYRHLQEQLNISSIDIELSFVRQESTATGYGATWSLFVSAGILNKDIDDIPDGFEWVEITDTDYFLESYSYGNCFVFLREAIRILSK